MNGEIALILMSHGEFAKAAMESVEMVVGKQDNYETMGIQLIDNVDALKEEMFTKVSKLDTGAGLIVFTDILGGTPMNLAGNLLTDKQVIICSGLSLPVLLECIMNRSKDINEMADILKAAHNNSQTILTSEVFDKEDEDDLFL